MTVSTSGGERLLDVNGVELCVETFGDPADPAVLFVDGAAASMLWWDADLCERIATHGRFVIRYDNRDTGRSTCYPPGEPGYSLRDLADDALGILDALHVGRAHVVVRSMAGGVGLILGVDHPDRVASLTFVSTSTGDPHLPPPSPALGAHRPPPPDPADPASVVEFVVATVRAYAGGSPHFDEGEVRTTVTRDVARARNVASTLTNHYAMAFDGPEHGGFGDITAPSLVVHGDRDPLLPPAHGEAVRDAVPGAELVVLPGAGHDLPRPVWDVFVPALVRHTAAATPRRTAPGVR